MAGRLIILAAAGADEFCALFDRERHYAHAAEHFNGPVWLNINFALMKTFPSSILMQNFYFIISYEKGNG